MKRKRKRLPFILFVSALILMFIFTNPKRAIRLNVLLKGFPKEALTSKVEYSHDYKGNIGVYYLDPTPVGNTGPLGLFGAKQAGPFYIGYFIGAI